MSSVGRALCCGVLALLAGCYFDGSGQPGSVGPEPEPDAALPDGAAAPDVPPTTTPDASAAPPPGYLPQAGQLGLYRAVATPRSLDDAATDCEDDGAGAHLLVIDDEEEDAAVRRRADDALAGGRIWIGITDLDDEGTWLTLDDEPLEYDHWNGGEPNDYDGEDCAVLLGLDDPPGHRGRWNDTDCEEQRPYLCEWSAD